MTKGTTSLERLAEERKKKNRGANVGDTSTRPATKRRPAANTSSHHQGQGSHHNANAAATCQDEDDPTYLGMSRARVNRYNKDRGTTRSSAVRHFLCSRSTMINEPNISPHVKRACENPGRAWTLEDENIAANQSIIDNNRSIALLVGKTGVYMERMSLQLTEQRLFYSETLSEMDDLRHELELLKKRNVELEAKEHSTQRLLLAKAASAKEAVCGKEESEKIVHLLQTEIEKLVLEKAEMVTMGYVEDMSNMAYVMAFSDCIRTSWNAGNDVSALVAEFIQYLKDEPPPIDEVLIIGDLFVLGDFSFLDDQYSIAFPAYEEGIAHVVDEQAEDVESPASELSYLFGP